LIKERNELAKKVAAEEIPDPTTIIEEEEDSTIQAWVHDMVKFLH